MKITRLAIILLCGIGLAWAENANPCEVTDVECLKRPQLTGISVSGDGAVFCVGESIDEPAITEVYNDKGRVKYIGDDDECTYEEDLDASWVDFVYMDPSGQDTSVPGEITYLAEAYLPADPASGNSCVTEGHPTENVSIEIVGWDCDPENMATANVKLPSDIETTFCLNHPEPPTITAEVEEEDGLEECEGDTQPVSPEWEWVTGPEFVPEVDEVGTFTHTFEISHGDCTEGTTTIDYEYTVEADCVQEGEYTFSGESPPGTCNPGSVNLSVDGTILKQVKFGCEDYPELAEEDEFELKYTWSSGEDSGQGKSKSVVVNAENPVQTVVFTATPEWVNKDENNPCSLPGATSVTLTASYSEWVVIESAEASVTAPPSGEVYEYCEGESINIGGSISRKSGRKQCPPTGQIKSYKAAAEWVSPENGTYSVEEATLDDSGYKSFSIRATDEDTVIVNGSSTVLVRVHPWVCTKLPVYVMTGGGDTGKEVCVGADQSATFSVQDSKTPGTLECNGKTKPDKLDVKIKWTAFNAQTAGGQTQGEGTSVSLVPIRGGSEEEGGLPFGATFRAEVNRDGMKCATFEEGSVFSQRAFATAYAPKCTRKAHYELESSGGSKEVCLEEGAEPSSVTLSVSETMLEGEIECMGEKKPDAKWKSKVTWTLTNAATSDGQVSGEGMSVNAIPVGPGPFSANFSAEITETDEMICTFDEASVFTKVVAGEAREYRCKRDELAYYSLEPSGGSGAEVCLGEGTVTLSVSETKRAAVLECFGKTKSDKEVMAKVTWNLYGCTTPDGRTAGEGTSVSVIPTSSGPFGATFDAKILEDEERKCAISADSKTRAVVSGEAYSWTCSQAPVYNIEATGNTEGYCFQDGPVYISVTEKKMDGYRECLDRQEKDGSFEVERTWTATNALPESGTWSPGDSIEITPIDPGGVSITFKGIVTSDTMETCSAPRGDVAVYRFAAPCCDICEDVEQPDPDTGLENIGMFDENGQARDRLSALIRLSVGDYSGSHSEKWGLTVGSVTLEAESFCYVTHSRITEGEFIFPRGSVYSARVDHLDNQCNRYDYDYDALINLIRVRREFAVVNAYGITQGNRNGSHADFVPMVIYDKQTAGDGMPLLGRYSTSEIGVEGNPPTKGKVAYISLPTVRMTLSDVEAGLTYEESAGHVYDPLLLMHPGSGDAMQQGYSLLGIVSEGTNTWHLSVRASLYGTDLDPELIEYEWMDAGSATGSTDSYVDITYESPGRYIPTAIINYDGEEISRVSLDSIVVLGDPGDTVPGIRPVSSEEGAIGIPMVVDTKIPLPDAEEMNSIVRIRVSGKGAARGRVSLSGRKENAYQCLDADIDLMQILPSNDSMKVYIQGYKEDSDQVNDAVIYSDMRISRNKSWETGWITTDAKCVTLFTVDADVDTDNNNANNYPSRTSLEDSTEESGGIFGKMLSLQDGDYDGDGVPDFADGYNLHGSDEWDDENEETPGDLSYPKLVIEVAGPVDNCSAYYSLEYSYSDPAAVSVTQKDSGYVDIYAPDESGTMRLWKTDPKKSRNITGEDPDIIPPNVWSEKLEDIDPKVLYMEAVRASGEDLGEHIILKAKFQFNGTVFEAEDRVLVRPYDISSEIITLDESGNEVLANGTEIADVPTPDLTCQMTDPTIDIEDGNISFYISGSLRDDYSEVTRNGDQLESIYVYVNGNLIKSIPIRYNTYAGFWLERILSFDYDEEISIPIDQEHYYHVSVEAGDAYSEYAFWVSEYADEFYDKNVKPSTGLAVSPAVPLRQSTEWPLDVYAIRYNYFGPQIPESFDPRIYIGGAEMPTIRETENE